jgi:hypothetical protein
MSQVILYGRFSADPLWPDLGDPQGDLAEAAAKTFSELIRMSPDL